MGFNFLGFGKTNIQNTEIEINFPLCVGKEKFIEWYIKRIYARILFDCRAKASGFSDKYDDALYDSYISTEMPFGLISLVVDAMYRRGKIYLVYKSGVVSKATLEEQQEIDRKIKNAQQLKNEVVIDFKNFDTTELLKVYSGILYKALETANTGMNMSQSVILKIKDYRGTISVASSGEAAAQGKAIARGVKTGRGVMADAGDSIELPIFDVEPMEKSVVFINGMISNALGFPLSYVNGALTTGISTTGEADELAVDRGLKYFFFAIFKPIVDNLFDLSTQMKTDNWRKLSAVSNLVPIIESSSIISDERKEKLIEELFE